MLHSFPRRRGLPAICLSLLAGALPAAPALAAPAAPAARAPDAPKPEKLVSVEGITEYKFANGLRVLLFPDPSTQRVTVNLTVMVGSRHEGYGETGMAHLLEHMVFKGTPVNPDVPKALRDHGASFNGTTWFDRTNYFETMTADPEGKNLEFGIALEADRMVNSLIRKEDLQSEFSVVRSEFESGENNPERILLQRMMSAAYEWHNYGKSTIGNRSDIERVPVDNLRAFYKRFYQPDNAILVIAGKFDEAKALDLVGKHFGKLPKPDRKLDLTYTEEPAQDGERHVSLRRVGKSGAVGAVYHIPSGVHEDYPALEVLGDILDAEPTGRLYKAMVETKKATAVGVGAFGLADPGVLYVLATVNKDASLAEAREAMIGTLEKLSAGTFTEEEVERAKRKMHKDRELLMADAGRVAVTLSEWASKGDWRLFFLHRDRLAKVTVADVARVAAAYLQRNNRTVGEFIPSDKPERATIPATPVAADLVKDYKGGAAVAAGEDFDPTPANIETRVKRGTLSTGIKTALLPKKSRGDLAVVRLTLRYGNEESLKGKATPAADFIADMLERGTKKHPRKEFQDELDKLGAELSVGGQPGLLSIGVQVKKANLAATLALVGEMLREPAFPADEFDTLKRQQLEELRKGLADPQTRARTALSRHLSPYPPEDVRYNPTLEEEIARTEALTVDQVKAVYAEQVSGSHGELVMVGDFDPEAAPKQVDAILTGWKSSVPFRRIPRPAVNVSGGKLIIDTPDKANAVYVAAHTIPMTDSDPDYPAAKIANFLLGEAPLASRLSNRVRGKDGLSYGVGAQFQAHPVDKSTTFLTFAICNPANIEKVDKAIAEELEKMLKTGVTAEELEGAKTAYLQALRVRRATDAAVAGELANHLFAGRTFQYSADFEKKVEALTVKEANEAFQRHVNPAKLFVIWAGDFKKPAEKKPDAKK